jgi:hypothetical protein
MSHVVAYESGRACEKYPHGKNLGVFILNADHLDFGWIDPAPSWVFASEREIRPLTSVVSSRYLKQPQTASTRHCEHLPSDGRRESSPWLI